MGARRVDGAPSGVNAGQLPLRVDPGGAI